MEYGTPEDTSMSDVTVLRPGMGDVPMDPVAAKKWATETLGQLLWRLHKNDMDRKALEMDKIFVVQEGWSPSFTRFMMGGGQYQEFDGGGYYKGDASPGMVMRETQHHAVAYHNVQAFLREAPGAGYRLSEEHRRQLTEEGVTYATNGMDNRLHWVFEVTPDLMELVTLAGYTASDRIDDRGRPVEVGDWLCCSEDDERVTDAHGVGSRKSFLKVDRVRSEAYGRERFRFLDRLL